MNRWGVEGVARLLRGRLVVVGITAGVGAAGLLLGLVTGAQGPASAVPSPSPARPASLAEAASLPEAPMAEPPHVPPPIRRRTPATLRADIRVVEKTMRLGDGVEYAFWTLNGTVPGPFIRVRQGDTLVIRLTNPEESHAPHAIDLHSVTGPGGGATLTLVNPGETKAFAWKALKAGLYVYHCAAAPAPMHIANGMYGLILVEPEAGMAPVDREYYVMQQELYVAEPAGRKGQLEFSWEAMMDERPAYVVFNGALDALAGPRALAARTGERVRLFFGVGGPNLVSSLHVIGEIFDRVYELGSLTSAPRTDVQTTLVPPGGAVVAELAVEVPGTYTLVDHALGRLHKGAAAQLVVHGEERPDIYRGLK